MKTVSPGFLLAPAEASVRNLSYSLRFTTLTWARIVACPSPQSSVHIKANCPVLFGVITSVVSIPGTASDFWPNSGTQNEWITSTEFNVSLTGSSTGSTSWPEVTLVLPGYSNFQANCCAVTAIRSGFAPASLFFASTTALTIEIAVTSTAGIAVQTISSPV